jgi:hypothetical protein
MKFIMLIALLLSSTAFAGTLKVKAGTGYEKRDGDYIQIFWPEYQEMEIDCSSPFGISTEVQSQMNTSTITTYIFALETHGGCSLGFGYSIDGGPSRSLGVILITSPQNINETIFSGTPVVLEDGYVYTPSFGIANPDTLNNSKELKKPTADKI